MAQTQQHGISRSRFHPRAEQVEGRADLESLARDVKALSRTVQSLERQLHETVNRLVERMNQMILSGSLALRPIAGVADRFYFVTDSGSMALYFDDGLVWRLVGSPTSQTIRTVVADGDLSATLTVAQPNATYKPAFSTTWWTMVKITTQTATQLIVAFSNPPQAGDVLTTVIP